MPHLCRSYRPSGIYSASGVCRTVWNMACAVNLAHDESARRDCWHAIKVDAKVLARDFIVHRSSKQPDRGLHGQHSQPFAGAAMAKIHIAAALRNQGNSLRIQSMKRSGRKFQGSPQMRSSWLVPYTSSKTQVPFSICMPRHSKSLSARPPTAGKKG